jgi:hypothetical protein
MALRRFARVAAVALCLGLASSARAAVWSGSFTDMGVEYTLSLLSESGGVGSFELSLDTTGYSGPAGAFLDSVDIKAWDGGSAGMSFVLVSAPAATLWTPSEGPISSGPVDNAGCHGSDAGFVCVEAITKGVLDVASGSDYRFRFDVTASSFLASPFGAHVGASYADANGNGAGFGITGVTMVPEPGTYALLLAGIGLLVVTSTATRRRR